VPEDDRAEPVLSEEQLAALQDYARARLEEVLYILDNGADLDILSNAELALMALSMLCGASGPITLNPAEILEIIAEPAPVCICPPGLPERGGFRSGCPVHH
jgi:hypothetical protein